MEFKSNTSIIVLGCILISIMLCLSNALINISISTNKDILDDVFEKEAYLIVNACNKRFINEIDSYKFEFETSDYIYIDDYYIPGKNYIVTNELNYNEISIPYNLDYVTITYDNKIVTYDSVTFSDDIFIGYNSELFYKEYDIKIYFNQYSFDDLYEKVSDYDITDPFNYVKINNTIKTTNIIISILNSIFLIFTFMIMYSIVNLIIVRRYEYIRYLKIMGADNIMIFKIYLVIFMLVFFISLGITLILNIPLTYLINNIINGMFDISLKYKISIMSIIEIIVVNFISLLVTKYKINKVNSLIMEDD